MTNYTLTLDDIKRLRHEAERRMEIGPASVIALCDRVLATAPRPAGEGEVEGLIERLRERGEQFLNTPRHPATARGRYPEPEISDTLEGAAANALARQQAEIASLRHVHTFHKEANESLSRANGELLKRAYEAERDAERAAREEAEGKRDAALVRAHRVEKELMREWADEIALREAAEARLAELTRIANEAIDAIGEWGAYASEYFQQKHDLEGEINRLHQALSAAQGEESDEPAITKQMADVLAAFARNALFYKPDTPHCEMVSIPFDYLRAALVVCEKAGIMPKLPDHIGAEEDHESLTEAREAHRAYHNVIAQTAAQGETLEQHPDATVMRVARRLCQQHCRAVICRKGCKSGYPGPGYGWFEAYIVRAQKLLAAAQGEGEADLAPEKLDRWRERARAGLDEGEWEVIAGDQGEGLKKPVQRFEDTFSAETVVMETYFPDRDTAAQGEGEACRHRPPHKEGP